MRPHTGGEEAAIGVASGPGSGHKGFDEPNKAGPMGEEGHQVGNAVMGVEDGEPEHEVDSCSYGAGADLEQGPLQDTQGATCHCASSGHRLVVVAHIVVGILGESCASGPEEGGAREHQLGVEELKGEGHEEKREEREEHEHEEEQRGEEEREAAAAHEEGHWDGHVPQMDGPYLGPES